MYAFGVDMPLVELLVGIVVLCLIILIEITVVLIMLMYKMKNFKKLHNSSLELVKTLLKLKQLETRKR